MILVCAIWKGALKVSMLNSSDLYATIVGDRGDRDRGQETGDLSPDGSKCVNVLS